MTHAGAPGDRGAEIIAARNGASQVVSISPSGQIQVIEDPATGARNPSAVALSGDGGLYVTNAAFLTVAQPCGGSPSSAPTGTAGRRTSRSCRSLLD